jgi:hypothetical protein
MQNQMGVYRLTLRSPCMLSSSLDVGGSDDAFDAFLNTLSVVILVALGCHSFDAHASLPLVAVQGVPSRTIYDVVEKNRCK